LAAGALAEENHAKRIYKDIHSSGLQRCVLACRVRQVELELQRNGESEEFENFKEAFKQFFTYDQKENDRTLEVIEHILEVFGDG
jgi:hypothetical protein